MEQETLSLATLASLPERLAIMLDGRRFTLIKRTESPLPHYAALDGRLLVSPLGGGKWRVRFRADDSRVGILDADAESLDLACRAMESILKEMRDVFDPNKWQPAEQPKDSLTVTVCGEVFVARRLQHAAITFDDSYRWVGPVTSFRVDVRRLSGGEPGYCIAHSTGPWHDDSDPEGSGSTVEEAVAALERVLKDYGAAADPKKW